MPKALQIFFILWSFSSFAQEQKLSTAEIATFKKEVMQQSEKIKSLKTDFIQYKHLSFLSKEIETSGNMVFQAPDLLNWRYTKPYQYSIVFRKGKIHINDQGNRTSFDASTNKMFEKINKLIVGSVSGNMFDDNEFTISYFKNKTHYIAKFIPKAKDLKQVIEEVELYFPFDKLVVSEVKLNESSGDYTKIIFKNQQLNAKVSPSDFTN